MHRALFCESAGTFFVSWSAPQVKLWALLCGTGWSQGPDFNPNPSESFHNHQRHSQYDGHDHSHEYEWCFLPVNSEKLQQWPSLCHIQYFNMKGNCECEVISVSLVNLNHIHEIKEWRVSYDWVHLLEWWMKTWHWNHDLRLGVTGSDRLSEWAQTTSALKVTKISAYRTFHNYTLHPRP